ncbi:AraC family transcriptional regulator [Photobacterium alginatilyticum]|uniref:AraC family transcriptional regulator n=1 Tax=Photobacterium alginatilyticum TaxID=1775171 RepID=A0ABW9YQ29_9GAMM|nr:helix-turn-helix domain-containing protein [Photobacterium alginatilyticum]NBI55987.1 AraC family transcriptional regulator [Photobacterium alginatilyticum]
MNTWKQAPLDPTVAQFVECYWLLEINYGDNERPSPLLIPNPSCHLVITPPKTIHRYQYTDKDGSNLVQRTGSHIIMPPTRALTLLDDKQVLRLGVKFLPGAQYQLFGLEGKATVNQTFDDLPAIHPLLQSNELESLLQFKTEQHRVIEALDDYFTAIIRQTSKDRHSLLTIQALQILAQQPALGIEHTLGCSRKTLERSFAKVTGLTPKQYELMVRLDKLLLFIYQQPEGQLDWASIATQFGFSDQPHLIRMLKKTIGATPGGYLNARNLIIDIYGDFESS